MKVEAGGRQGEAQGGRGEAGGRYSRSLLASGDDESVPERGVHGEHRTCVGFGHYSH